MAARIFRPVQRPAGADHDFRDVASPRVLASRHKPIMRRRAGLAAGEGMVGHDLGQVAGRRRTVGRRGLGRIDAPEPDFHAPDPERIAVADAADRPGDRAEGGKRRSLLPEAADDPRAGQGDGRDRKRQKEPGVQAEARFRKS